MHKLVDAYNDTTSQQTYFRPVVVSERTSSGRNSDHYWLIIVTSTASLTDHYWFAPSPLLLQGTMEELSL